MPRTVTNKKQNDVADFTGDLDGDIIGTQYHTQINPGAIVNADINVNATIADTKLATISTGGKVANSATSATASASPNTIVLRDGSNNTTFNTVFSNLDSLPAGTVNIGTTNANTLNIGTAPTTQIVNVGTGSGITTINLGGAGDTVNVAGTLTYINTTNLNVTDSNVTLNKGGASGSGSSSGISIEEGGATTGYLQTDGTRASWLLKAPASAGITTITPGASGITLNQSSHNPVTLGTANGLNLANQQLSLGTASTSTVGALNATDWNTFNTAASSVSNGLSGDITGALNATQISPGVIVNADINASAAIADTKLATLTSSGKVANSATSATASNTDGAIVLRNNTSGTNLGAMNIQGNLYLQRYPTGSDYRVLTMDTGNSRSYIFANFPQLGDTFNFGYNWFYDTGASTPTYYNSGQSTSRISMTGGQISLCTNSAAASAPIEYLRVASGSVSTQNGANFVGNLTGNVTGNCSGSAATFTGSLSGDITGTIGATQISAGVIVNADINAAAAITDTKLATITSSGKIANSATSATSANTDGTIVLRNNTGTTNLGHLTTGDIELTASDATYHSIRLGGGNSTGYLFGYYPALADGIHLTYNNAYLNSGTITIPKTAGGTSRVTCGYGSISLCAGGAGVAPTEYLRVDYSGSISTQNGGVFTGNLTGNVTGSSTQIKTSNGSVSTNGSVSPTSAGMALVSTSTSAAQWVYPQPWVYWANFGGSWTGTTYHEIGPYPWPNVPLTGKYLVEVKILGFSNTNNAATNTITVIQNGTTIKTISWIATYQQEFSTRFIYTFPTTAGIDLYGQTSTGSVTIYDHELYLLKINDN